MSERPYMPLYTADYRDATAHLSAAQHGAYLLLLMSYWSKGSLPKDERLLARISCMSDREWKANREVIAAFFDADWKHERVEKELAKAREKSEARAASGARGGNAKALNNKKPPVAKATILPEQTPSKTLPSSSGSVTEKKEEVASQPNARAGKAAAFDAWWQVYPHKVGKDKAEPAFYEALKKADLPTLIGGIRQYIADKPPDRNWCNPATWLNQGRWKDQPAVVVSLTTPSASNGRHHEARNGSLTGAFADLRTDIARREDHARRPDDELPFDAGGGLQQAPRSHR